MSFEIQYHELVYREDIPKLPKTVKEQIKRAIEKKLTAHPEIYGKPLRRSLKGYRKLRVSSYRAIFRLEQNVVKIFIIQHRSVVYKTGLRRIFN